MNKSAFIIENKVVDIISCFIIKKNDLNTGENLQETNFYLKDWKFFVCIDIPSANPIFCSCFAGWHASDKITWLDNIRTNKYHFRFLHAKCSTVEVVWLRKQTTENNLCRSQRLKNAQSSITRTKELVLSQETCKLHYFYFVLSQENIS